MENSITANEAARSEPQRSGGASAASEACGGTRPALEADQRQLVVNAARSWLGTPYHHEGDVKGAGVDCGMLIVRVFVDTGLVPPFDPRPYARHWYLHRDEERYLGFVFDRTREVAAPQAGDVVVWRVGRTYSHGGIVSQWPKVIHAYARARAVIESDVSLAGIFSSERHPKRFFSYWGETIAPPHPDPLHHPGWRGRDPREREGEAGVLGVSP